MFAQVNTLLKALSSNIFNSSNINPSETINANNLCPGKLICANYVHISRSICRRKICQNKPNSDGIIRRRDLVDTNHVLPSKPIRTSHVCFVNSSLPTQQISLNILFKNNSTQRP